MKKLLFLIAILTFILVPQITHAQFDQRCWVKDDCVEARKFMLNLDGLASLSAEQKKLLEDGFIQDDQTQTVCRGDKDVTDRPVGFCMPATKAVTGISYGGRNTFDGIAQFIAFIYQYGIQIAGLLAIIMIIVAGVQWIISGGNTDSISKAKKRIYGSIIGLILIATSYTILNVINPNLVNLRPPDVWMINTIGMPTAYCSDLKATDKISKEPAFKTGQQLTEEQRNANFLAVTEWVNTPTTTSHCGNEYYVEKSGALTCTGTFCPERDGETQLCFDRYNTGNACHPANITGEIYASNFKDHLFSEASFLVTVGFNIQGWAWPWVTVSNRNPVILYIICNNGVSTRVNAPLLINPETQGIRPANKRQIYALGVSEKDIDDAVQKECSGTSKGGVKGFLVSFNMNEQDSNAEQHYVGRFFDPENTESNSGGRYVGFDLGDAAHSNYDCILKNAHPGHFFSADDIKKGIFFDINASRIYDIDNNEQRRTIYRYEDNRKEIYSFGTQC